MDPPLHSILKVSKYIIVRIKARHTYYVMHKTSYLTCEGIHVKCIVSNNIHHNYHVVMPETRLERHFKNIILSNQEKFDDTKTRKTKERQYNYHRKDKLGSAEYYTYTVRRTLHVHIRLKNEKYEPYYKLGWMQMLQKDEPCLCWQVMKVEKRNALQRQTEHICYAWWTCFTRLSTFLLIPCVLHFSQTSKKAYVMQWLANPILKFHDTLCRCCPFTKLIQKCWLRWLHQSNWTWNKYHHMYCTARSTSYLDLHIGIK